jgi:hypothetical protein
VLIQAAPRKLAKRRAARAADGSTAPLKEIQMLAKAVLALALSATIGIANAQNSEGGPGPAPQPGTSGLQGGVASDFGPGTNILQIPAAAFTPRGAGALTTYTVDGYVGWTTPGYMWAPVFLSSGAAIDWMDTYYCDNNTTGTGTLSPAAINFWLTRYTGYDDATRSFEDIPSASQQSVDGTGTGCQYASTLISPSHTVNNDAHTGGGQYVVVVQPTATAGLAFKAVDFWWRRQISPAPATASFTDVPTTYQFFQQIEALKAAGITSGCTATTFCPNDPITRGQMAAFLARALGLYWPF